MQISDSRVHYAVDLQSVHICKHLPASIEELISSKANDSNGFRKFGVFNSNQHQLGNDLKRPNEGL